MSEPVNELRLQDFAGLGLRCEVSIGPGCKDALFCHLDLMQLPPLGGGRFGAGASVGVMGVLFLLVQDGCVDTGLWYDFVVAGDEGGTTSTG